MAGQAVNSSIDPLAYAAAVERTEELARLQAQAQRRKSMLIFGPEAVGKTRLLRTFVQTHPFALFAAQVQSPREMLLALIEELRRVARPGISLPENCGSLRTGSLKGIVQGALEKHPFLLALDHLAGPSRIVTGLIKDLNYFDRTPVIFVARTPHMEDIGTLQPMCAGKSERLELKEFPPPVALEFARREANRMELWASNLDHVLHQFVDWSNGNPGTIAHLLKMAHFPRYFAGDQIKAHVLYLDYRMGRRE
ncbi:MAG TPA: TniB family NTP-binding protein [Terracidiphilus sp.]|nr:TniB family NTP-binding protein [Terracidiphilus sp.]